MKYLLAFLLLAGCAGEYQGHGVITSKDYYPAHTDWVPGYTVSGSTSCSGYGADRVCTRSPDIVIPGHEEYTPERYAFTIRDDKAHKHQVTVAGQTWGQCSTGQSYDTHTKACTSR